MKMKKIISFLCLGPAMLAVSIFGGAVAYAKNLPLKGVYEADEKVDGSRRQIYLQLDFVDEECPDFTQTFNAKTSDLKLLPADFMNAKKLKKSFAGSKAAGFARYREKTLFSLTEEMRLTNPRLKAGVFVVDWENDLGNKGTAIIVPDKDGSLVTYGLTSLDRSLSPDCLRLTLVKDLRPDTTVAIEEELPHLLDPKHMEFMAELASQCGKNYSDLIAKIDREPEMNPAGPSGSGSVVKNDVQSCEGVLAVPTEPYDIMQYLIPMDDSNPRSYQFHFHIVAEGGDYGTFETDATLEFWATDKDEFAMRQYANTAYVNGRVYDIGRVYYGKPQGNKIVFTHYVDEYGDGQRVKLEDWEANTLEIKGPKSVVFDRCEYNRQYYDNRKGKWIDDK